MEDGKEWRESMMALKIPSRKRGIILSHVALAKAA